MDQIKGRIVVLSKWRALSVSALCLLFGVAAPQAAMADLKITMHTAIDSPMMKNLPPAQAAMMSKFLDTTECISRKKIRINMMVMSLIVDYGTKKMTMINNMARSYSDLPFNPSMVRQMMPGSPSSNGALKSYKVLDTGKTTTLLGHRVRHYIVSERIATQNMGDMTVQGDMYAAQDLPEPDTASYDSLSSHMPGRVHVHGVPIKVVMKISGGQTGSMTMSQIATSISTAPVPASTFTIPEGYTKSQSAGMLGMGMPGSGIPGMGGPGQ